MRIAYVVTALTHEGPLNVVRMLIDEMTRRGHQCVLFYLEEREEADDFGCEKKRIGYREEVSLHEYDVVHTHGMKPMGLVALYLLLHKKPEHTLFVTTLHSFIGEEFKWRFGRWRGWLLSRCFLRLVNIHDKVITLSDAATEYYARWVSREKLMRCYHGMDLRMEAYERRSRQENIVVGTYCALQRIKGLDVLIRAMDYLPENYCLTIVGDGPERRHLHEMSRHLGQRVTLMAGQPEPYRLLPSFDVFVVSSYSEGFCLSLLEAACYGSEIVCSDIPGMREKFSDDELTYFEAGNAEDLARNIVKALHGSHGENARRKARQFSVEKMGEKHEEIYTK